MLQIDEGTANAVNSLMSKMPEEWATVEDYIARALCGVRDQMETGPKTERDERAGECAGLRYLFELSRRSFNKTNKEGPMQGIDKVILGEETYVRYAGQRDDEPNSS